MPITDPSDLGTTLCPAWWNPDDLTGSDGDEITTWTDNQNALALTGPASAKPHLVEAAAEPAAHKSVGLYSTNDRFTIGATAAINLALPCYVMLVAPFRIGSNENIWIFNKDNTSPATFSLRNGSTTTGKYHGTARLDGSEGTTRDSIPSSYFQEAIPQVVTVWYDGTEFIIRVNGTEVSALAVSGVIDTDNDAGLVIGNHPSAFRNCGCRFGDIVILDDPSITNVEDVENWMMSKWEVSTYNDDWTTGGVTDEMQPAAGEGEFFSASIVTVGSTNYLFAAVFETSGNSWRYLDYWTSPTSDPHNWTRNAGGYIVDSSTDSPVGVRGVAACHDGAAFHILVDAGDGSLYHFTGSSLSSLTDNGAVYSGGGLGSARHPTILQSQVGGVWYVYFDLRTTPTSGVGYVALVETSDFATFSNSRKVLDVSSLWWEKTDTGSPSVVLRDGQYEMAYQGFNDNVTSITPHFIGLAKSSDGETWTKLPQTVPILVPEAEKSKESVDSPELFHDGTNYWLYFTSRDSGGTDADISRVQLGADALAFLAAAATRSSRMLLLGVS